MDNQRAFLQGHLSAAKAVLEEAWWVIAQTDATIATEVKAIQKRVIDLQTTITNGAS